MARATTRRELLIGAGGGAAALALGGGALAADRLLASGDAKHPARTASTEGRHPHHYHSEPGLRPPALSVAGRILDPGVLLLGPGNLGRIQGGPLIVNRHGQPVWFNPLDKTKWPTNFTTATYRGEPVLTWWEGPIVFPIGYGQGEGVIVDAAYREVTRVRAAGGRMADLHEFLITPEGTALMTCFPDTVPLDLANVGGPRQGRVLNSIIQEVDIATGRLVMEWRSLDHIPVSESRRQLGDPYDYFHVNSIDIAPDGHLLISARHTWTIYKLDRRTGEVIWRLGGKRSDFDVAPDARFASQHHARQTDARTFSLFDNGYDGITRSEDESRAVILDVDESRRTARLAGAYYHPDTILVESMGSVELLPDGNVLVGWGRAPFVTEHTRAGGVVSDVRMPKGEQSYRAIRSAWAGSPTATPAIAAGRDRRTDAPVLYASWNGATEVHAWQVHAGAAPSRLRPARKARRRGFESSIRLHHDAAYAAVVALDRSGRPLGVSRTIPV